MATEKAAQANPKALPVAVKLVYPTESKELAARPRAIHVLVVIVFSLVLTSRIFLTQFVSVFNHLARSTHEGVQLPQPDSIDSLLHFADEWRDDVWPIRQQTPWDISTNFPYPRKLEYEVSEGTWLRLDIHPESGEIVFDMLGDLYCLMNESYSTSRLESTTPSRAYPVLLGVPHDSDPHFSPTGDRLVFRSDAGLGLENIWVMPWTGCESMQIRGEVHTTELSAALAMMDADDELLARGIGETQERKARRLVREGRSNAQRVTNETFRWTTDARFHPSGDKVVATKWYTSERSLGAGEGWEYTVPSLDELATTAAGYLEESIGAGSGKRLIGRNLPLGWSAAQYGDQQIGPEQFIWRGNDTLIYAMNVKDVDGTFQYNKDVHKGIYAIFSQNLTSGKTETLVGASPGGASRPELSRDGRTLAFVRRVRDKEVLALKDLETGTLHYVWDGLTYDLSSVSAPMGTYPSFAFTPSDSAILIWAAGQIYHVPLATNILGEKIPAPSSSARAIPFTAHVEKRLAETRQSETDLVSLETDDRMRVHAFRDLRVDREGQLAVFTAAGTSYMRLLFLPNRQGGPERVPVLHGGAAYYSPTIIEGENFRSHRILHVRWSDETFSTFEVSDLLTGAVNELSGLPIGRYRAPAVCECKGRTRTVAFLKTGGSSLTGYGVATANPGLYVGQITLPDSPLAFGKTIEVQDLKFVPSRIDVEDSNVKLRFEDGNKKLVVQQASKVFVIDLAGGPDGLGDYKHEDIVSGRMSTELAVSSASDNDAVNVAFVDFFQLYFAPNVKKGDVKVWSKPGNATEGLARLSLDGAHDVVFTGDGKQIFWFLGPYLHFIDVDDLSECTDAIEADPINFGIDCVRNTVDWWELLLFQPTDIKQLKRDARHAALRSQGFEDVEEGINVESVRNADVLVITNATVLTMSSGLLSQDLHGDSALVVRGGVVESVEPLESLKHLEGATYVDAEGGFVVPGFIDMHAHWNGYADLYPARSWEHAAFLAYGVTTMHNPSADNVQTSDETNRIEHGLLLGPRNFHTGGVIYGAGIAGLHADIIDMDEARAALVRIKVEAGAKGLSYKNYNLPSRASRQRLLLAARNLSMLCVPEGGMNLEWDLTYIIDGMTTVEHSLPLPVLFDDVQTLFALSGTGSTPTHIVNYGGTWGEQLLWATSDIPNDEKLRRFVPHDNLELLTESTARPRLSYQLFNTSQTTAAMVQKGLKAHIGAHGESPVGLMYHAELYFAREGGLTNYETIRAATSDAAETLGLQSSIGSLAPGLLADFVVYPPGVNLLEDDIQVTRDIRYVARGGRLFQASTLEEVWPVKGREYALPPLNVD